MAGVSIHIQLVPRSMPLAAAVARQHAIDLGAVAFTTLSEDRLDNVPREIEDMMLRAGWVPVMPTGWAWSHYTPRVA